MVDQPGALGRPFPRTFAVIAAVAVAVFLALLLWEPFGTQATPWFDDLGTLAAGSLAFWWSRQAATRAAGRTRLAWRYVSFATFAWSLGKLYWAYDELLRRTPASQLFPSPADIGFLAFTPLMTVALLLFLPRAQIWVFRTRALVEGLWMAQSLFLVSWLLILEPILQTPQSLSLAEQLAFAYPFLDVFVAAAALTLLTRADADTRGSIRCIVGGALLLAVADSAFAYASLNATYVTGNLFDVGWLGGMLLVALGARMYGTGSLAPQPTRANLRTILGPFLPFLLGTLVLIEFALRHGHLDLDDLGLWLIAISLLLVRETFTHLENLRLTTRLEDALSGRDAIVRAVVHDLKNPLSPIKIQTHLLGTHPDFPPALQPGVKILERNIRQIEALIQDLQDMTALDSGHLRLEPTDVDLAQAAREACDALRPPAEARNLQLVVDAPRPVAVRADPARLGQVFGNLVGNALKFTPDGGTVRVVVETRDGRARASVTDSGRGLDAADLPQLFRPFSRIQVEGDRKPGTGLGLYLCRGIMEGQGGIIWATSPGRGQGSTFIIELPGQP